MRTWSGVRVWAAALVLVLGAWTPAEGQERRPSRLFAVDAEILGGSVSFAHLRDDGSYLGLALGVGGSLTTRMLLAGRHFSHEDGPSYQERDGATDQQLIEILHLGLFRRWKPSHGQSYDVGIRGSVFIHSNSFDDDPGLPLFFGAYGNALFGWRRIKFGPRVLVGVFTEGGGTTELGVFLVPFTGRLELGW